MPTSSKNLRRGQEDKGRVGKLPEKAASFHGRISVSKGQILRPKTQPDLLSGRKLAGKSPENTTPPNPKLTKLLLNVTVQRSLGPVQVVTSPESTVGDLIREAVRQYVKEGRRPLLTTTDSDDFDLHYTQFSLEIPAGFSVDFGVRCKTCTPVGRFFVDKFWRVTENVDDMQRLFPSPRKNY